jgi:hypothetical protein
LNDAIAPGAIMLGAYYNIGVDFTHMDPVNKTKNNFGTNLNFSLYFFWFGVWE